MFGQCLLLGTGISGISTGVYAVFTSDKYDQRDRKNEYITIFSIILFVSVLMIFLFQGNSESLVNTSYTHSASASIGGGKPPF
jgi:hypothetical protein